MSKAALLELAENRRAKFNSLLSPKRENGCIEWIGPHAERGYGIFYPKGTIRILAHRASYMLAHKCEIPAGLLVCHTCDNPPCVNPDHLWLGTDADNHRDAMKKGRASLSFRDRQPENRPHGELHGCAKLTEREAVSIFLDERPAKVVAPLFHVSENLIYRIRNRSIWRRETEGLGKAARYVKQK